MGLGLRQARVHRDQNRAQLKRRRSVECPDEGWTERGRRYVANRMWARATTQRRRKGRGSTASETVRARRGARVWARFWGRRRWWWRRRRGRGGGSNLEMVAENWKPFGGIGVEEEEII